MEFFMGLKNFLETKKYRTNFNFKQLHENSRCLRNFKQAVIRLILLKIQRTPMEQKIVELD
jgi:hypothetical protein